MSQRNNYLSRVSPGVRVLVAFLNSSGWPTTDSGDGSNHAAGMEGALPYRHVFGIVPSHRCVDLINQATSLQQLLRANGWGRAVVEFNIRPGEPVMYVVMPDIWLNEGRFSWARVMR